MRLFKIFAVTITLLLGVAFVGQATLPPAYTINLGDGRWNVKLNAVLTYLYDGYGTLNTTVSNWVGIQSYQAATYISTSSFSVPEDLTSKYPPTQFLLLDQGVDDLVANTVVSSSYGGGITTVIVTAANLTANLARAQVLNPTGSDVVVAADYGPTQANLATADGVAWAAKKRLRIDQNYSITSNLSLVAITQIQPGAVISIATGRTLTMSVPEAGRHQIFACTGTGKVVFTTGTGGKILPEWWGAIGDGTTNNAAAIQAAIVAATSVPSAGGVTPRLAISFAGGTYAVESCLDGTELAGLVMKGVGGAIQHGTIILGKTGAGKAILDVSGSPGAQVEGFCLQGSTSTIGLISSRTTVNGCNNQVFRDFTIYMASAPAANAGLGTVGVILQSSENITFDHINIYADVPVIMSAEADLSWFASPGANTFTVASEYATVAELSQGVVTFVGDCSLVGYHTRPMIAMYNANTVDLGNTYIGAVGAAVDSYSALYIRSCVGLTWRGHAEGFNTLVEIPGLLTNANINVLMTPVTVANPILNMNPAAPGVSGGELTNSRISVVLPTGATAGCVMSSTDAAHPSVQDNVIISVHPWVIGDIATIKPNANIINQCRNVKVEVLGGYRNYVYGEGAWVPTIQGGTAAGAGTYTVQQGKYTIQGDLVTVQGVVAWSAHTGTGNLKIVLPFACTALANYSAAGSIVPYTLGYTKAFLSMLVGAGESFAYLLQKDAADASSVVVPITATGTIMFTVVYHLD